jgi:hypothetical protein
MKKQILEEMAKLKRFERVALNSIVVDDLNELEMKFIIEKVFESNDMIVRLQNVLKELEEE